MTLSLQGMGVSRGVAIGKATSESRCIFSAHSALNLFSLINRSGSSNNAESSSINRCVSIKAAISVDVSAGI